MPGEMASAEKILNRRYALAFVEHAGLSCHLGYPKQDDVLQNLKDQIYEGLLSYELDPKLDLATVPFQQVRELALATTPSSNVFRVEAKIASVSQVRILPAPTSEIARIILGENEVPELARIKACVVHLGDANDDRFRVPCVPITDPDIVDRFYLGKHDSHVRWELYGFLGLFKGYPTFLLLKAQRLEAHTDIENFRRYPSRENIRAVYEELLSEGAEFTLKSVGDALIDRFDPGVKIKRYNARRAAEDIADKIKSHPEAIYKVRPRFISGTPLQTENPETKSTPKEEPKRVHSVAATALMGF